MSCILKSLSIPELNAYVVLIHCCISVWGGDLQSLESDPEPHVYIEDLIERGWSVPESAILICVLEKKGLIRFGQFNDTYSYYNGVYLTKGWRELDSIWPQVSSWTTKIDEPGDQHTVKW